ncbi:MAG: molecular chaperone DnaJ [Myxococcales bacterium]|nr:molecular chaperone DnaJ [Myxococcales bacterium]
MKRDYYEVLGVERTSDATRIKKAFRRIALAHHPDQNPDDPEAAQIFREASEAYEVLGDTEKRDLYDRYGHEGVEGRVQTAGADLHDIFSHFGDFFGDLFGGGPFQKARKGRDLRVRLDVPFAEVLTGAERSISLRRHRPCQPCGATGSETKQGPEACGMCSGTGQVVQRQGLFVMSTTCPRCEGAGGVIKDPCSACDGAGAVVQAGDLMIQVPAGVSSGLQVRLRGEGDQSNPQLPPGDLLVVFRVEDAPEPWVRDGADLHQPLPLDLPTAVLGGDVEIEGLDGPVVLSVPPGTGEGTVLPLRDLGLPHPAGHRGDLLAHVQLQVPRPVEGEARELWQALKNQQGETG